jgi:hypothetical protein
MSASSLVDSPPTLLTAGKTCPCCERPLALSAFNSDRSGKDGLACWCRDCQKDNCFQRYYRNQEQRKETARNRHANNTKRINEASRTRYQRDKVKPGYGEKRKRYAKTYKHLHADRVRAYYRMKTYGVSPEVFLEMFTRQNGRCAICLDPISDAPNLTSEERCHIDHDHETGAVRGLLCNRCNRGLGQFKDDLTRLKGAVAYLTSHMRQQS